MSHHLYKQCLIDGFSGASFAFVISASATKIGQLGCAAREGPAGSSEDLDGLLRFRRGAGRREVFVDATSVLD